MPRVTVFAASEISGEILSDLRAMAAAYPLSDRNEGIGADMVLFECYALSSEAIGRIGEDVRAQARATNTPVSYTDPASGTDVIREYPDGRRERVKADGSVVAVPSRKH
jgi:hypothetical protein